MNRHRTLALLALFASPAWSPAADDVDLQVRGNEKVDGTLRPADERESFLVAAPLGATITASVKQTGDGGPVPTLEVLDGTLAVIAQGTPNATGSKLNRHVVEKSDLLRLRVAGDGVLDGDYQFKLKMTTRRAWGESSETPLAAGDTTVSKFAAPAGSTADVALGPGRGSDFAARILSIDGPDGFHFDADDSGVSGAKHKVSDVPLGASGDYTVKFRNDGAAPGTWTIGVKLGVPRVSKTNVDIADSALTGTFGGEGSVFGRVVDSAGALIDPPDTGGSLDGASVSIPPGAMPVPTVIAIQSSDTFFVDDTNHAAGIAINLTPSGTTFATPVTVTVPFDPQAFDDPANEVSIYIANEETGALEAVPRDQLVIDVAASTVSFPASHFSRFQGTSPRPRAVKGTFVQLELLGGAQQGFNGAVVFGLSRVDALAGSRTGNGFARTADRRGVVFGPSSLVRIGPSGAQDFGTLDVVSDQAVTMQSSTEGPTRFVRGRNGDVLIQPPSQGGDPPASSVLLRVTKGLPTPANLAGDWNATVFEFTAARSQSGAVELETVGQNLRLRFGLDLSVVASKASLRASSVGAVGEWRTTEDHSTPGPGTLTLTQGRVSLAMALGRSKLMQSIPLVPVLSGDALVGIADGLAGSDKLPTAVAVRMVVLVRVPTTAGPMSLAGNSLYSAFGLRPIDRPGAFQGLGYIGEDFLSGHDGGRVVTISGIRVSQEHDVDGNGVGVRSDVDVTGTYAVGRDGTYREFSPPAFGAVAPRSGFYVTTRFFGPALVLGFGVVAPPKQ